MPKEKLLCCIGVWLILLSYFIGLPTEIKNYLFLATGLLIILMSYSLNFKEFKHQKNTPEEPPKIQKEKIVSVEEMKEFASLKIPPARMYGEPELKVRKRSEKRTAPPKEERAFTARNVDTTPDTGDEEDVIVISSDGDK